MRKLKRKVGFVCALILCIICCNIQALATENQEHTREIRVGYSASDTMIHKDNKGKFYGYGVTYLNELAKYTGWEYEYVEVEETDRISALKEGTIDLLCDVHKDCIPGDDMCISEQYSGMEYGMLCARKDNHDIFYNDYSGIDGKKVGVPADKALEKELLEYAKSNGISYETVYFEGYGEMQEALQNGTVDMILISSLKDKGDSKYVGKTGIEETYFAVNKDQGDLMEELDAANGKLRQERPFYVSAIYESFFGQPYQKLTGITREEYEFVKKTKKVRVACDANSYPVEYVDKETGEYCGAYAEAIKLISEESGLEFEFVPQEDFSKAWDLISNGEVDLIAGNFGNSKTAEYYGITYSQSYLSVEYTVVGRKGMRAKENLSLALPRNYVGLRYFFQDEEPGWEIVLYDSVKDCFKAVEKGKVDVTAVNSLFLQTVYNLDQYSNLKVVPNMTKSLPISIGIGRENDNAQVLKSILDKAIFQIPDSSFERCVTENAINISYEPTVIEVIGKIFPEICVALLAIVLVVVYVISRREKHFRYLAMTDPVTGLWNRVKFYQEAQKLLEKNKEKTYLLITLDINKFKFINNDFGSKVGDKFLYVMGERIRKIFEGEAYYARNTADMFLILIEKEKYQTEMLLPLSEAIYFNNNGKRQYCKISVKAGIRTILPEDERTDLVLYVDQASLARKTIKDSVNQNQAYYDEKMKSVLEKENAIEKKMEAALQNREFQVYLQPKYDLRTESIKGAEALIRWIDPEQGMVPPDQFIPLFEKNGFILKVDFYVYEEVMKRMAQWREEGKEPICISVNVSRVHVGTADFFEKLNELVEKYQISKEYFELELTETIMGGAKSQTRTFIRECKKEGYKVSIDDFGSGYSSLNLLKDLPVDILKIDKGFLDETEESRRSTIIVEQVVEMAKKMKIGTLCEGVETEKQARFLKDIGCDMAQGYLFSRPVPMEEFEQMI